MEEPLAYLKKRANDDWLIGYDSRQFNQIAEKLYLELIQLLQQGKLPKILLAERNPIKFLAGLIAACAASCPVFLCNPDWVEAEWQQVFDLVQPDLIWGDCTKHIRRHRSSPSYSPSPPAERGGVHLRSLIMIPTGGSSGKIRFAIHTWETLMASVQGFTQYFQVSSVNSFCVLPLYHVSGLMQFMRSFTTGGHLVILPFKTVEAGETSNINPSEFFISLVPTQLQRLLPHNAPWLSTFQTVLLGGAPAWTELLQAARLHQIRLAPTYGMTETASQIVSLKPEEFLNANNSSGRALPHAKVTIRNSKNKILDSNQPGIITIQSNSLFLGYYPNIFLEEAGEEKIFQPDDLGLIDESGYLNIIGRNSHKIITGGENVFPSEVEAAIQATNLVTDICVIGLPDLHWGQVITAVYVPIHPDIPVEKLQREIESKLSKFKRPKHWIPVNKLPRNPQGKVNHEQIKVIAMAYHHSNDLASE